MYISINFLVSNLIMIMMMLIKMKSRTGPYKNLSQNLEKRGSESTVGWAFSKHKYSAASFLNVNIMLTGGGKKRITV